MAVENPLPFLRALAEKRPLPPAVLIFGPQVFLREYVLDALRIRTSGDGLEYRTFQIGAGDDFGAVIDELLAPGLFASRKLIVCRVLRARRERSSDDGEARSSKASRGADEAALAAAIERSDGRSHLVVLYETAPAAKLRQAIESHGAAVNCNRPFDNQIGQYAQLFARSLGVKLSSAAAELVSARYGTDLAALNNALSRASINREPGATIDAADLREPAAQGVPEAFELADSLARGQAPRAVALLDRSLATGRDTFELLAVEIVPVLRRMLIAASMLRKRDCTAADIARVLGLPPSSPMALRAVEGARRLGLQRLSRGYRAAAELDAGFKTGQIRGREQALSGLIIELFAAPQA
ncbi:MAG: DNA polymerase III subunit delta [Candidatus Binataceae bacterium]|jgi:DNA polymerase III delta subunit